MFNIVERANDKGVEKMSQCSSDAQNSRVCSDAERYVQKELKNPPKAAVVSCEGGCVKGEISRVAANILAYRLEKESAIRICLGDAVTGNSGMFELVKRAPVVIAIEGCPLQCGTEMLKLRCQDIKTNVINASSLYEYDREKYFGILDMPNDEVVNHAQKVARFVQQEYFINPNRKLSNNKTCCS